MNKLSTAIKLRENGKPEEALKIIKELLLEQPEDPSINYQYAWCCDVLGKEREAAPYYEKALANGLSGADRKEAYLGLGSTYRTIGEYMKSERILLDALAENDDNALRVFLAMTKYNLCKHEEAMEILLNLLANTSDDKDIKCFKKAIMYYADKLNKVW